MKNKFFAEIVINKESLSDGKPVFVSHCINLGITSQGRDMDEAIKNIKEAIFLYVEEQPEAYTELSLSEEPPLFSIIEVAKNAKVASAVR